MSIKAKIDGDNNIVIQNADNSTITINTNDPAEIRKIIIDFQNKLELLPNNILKLIMDKNTNNNTLIEGANVYLGLNILSDFNSIIGIAFGVTITNLTKENRFFNQPFFKFSVETDKGFDSFTMTDIVDKVIAFPKKLEYGEVITQTYKISPSFRSIIDEVLAKDLEATITAFTSTTIGETYSSNEYKVKLLSDNLKYAR